MPSSNKKLRKLVEKLEHKVKAQKAARRVAEKHARNLIQSLEKEIKELWEARDKLQKKLSRLTEQGLQGSCRGYSSGPAAEEPPTTDENFNRKSNYHYGGS